MDKEIIGLTYSRQRLLVTVEGRPAPQGSKRPIGNGRFVEASKYLKPWRDAVILALKQNQEDVQNIHKFIGPVKVDITFFLERPKQPKWPYPATTPDIDKLIRAVLDSVTQAGIWEDDCQVVELHAKELWAGSSTDSYPVPGCRLYIEAL